MSAKPGAAESRYRVMEAFSDAYSNRAQVEVARIIGSSKDHAHRCHGDIRRVDGIEILDLAVADDGLCRAILRYLIGDDAPDGSPTAAIRDCTSALVDCGRAIQEIGEAMADQEISPGEARALSKTFTHIREKLAHYIADLDARAEVL